MGKRLNPEKTILISNDQFSEFKAENLNICTFMIIFDDIIIKPSLLAYLDAENQGENNTSMVTICKVKMESNHFS
ncbi:MAG: hypothetical protein R6U96_08010 [Promethearchaeia archaeon]